MHVILQQLYIMRLGSKSCGAAVLVMNTCLPNLLMLLSKTQKLVAKSQHTTHEPSQQAMREDAE